MTGTRLTAFEVTRRESDGPVRLNALYATETLAERGIEDDLWANGSAFRRSDYAVEQTGFTLVGFEPDARLRAACETALACFRALYTAVGDGADAGDLYGDQALWPLAQLREALGRVGATEPETRRWPN